MLAPDTHAVRVTGDFKAAPGLTTARNGLSAFGSFARLRLTHLPLSGESSTIYQHRSGLGFSPNAADQLQEPLDRLDGFCRFDVGPPFVGQEPPTRSTEELLVGGSEVGIPTAHSPTSKRMPRQ